MIFCQVLRESGIKNDSGVSPMNRHSVYESQNVKCGAKWGEKSGFSKPFKNGKKGKKPEILLIFE